MVLGQGRWVGRGVMAATLAALVTALSGCGNFFVYPGSSSSTGATGGDYAYVANSSSGSTYINGYSLSSGTLTAISGFPVSIGITPEAMVVTPNDSLLFIASPYVGTSSPVTPGLLYSWTIGSTGALTVNNNGNYVGGGSLSTNSDPVSLAVSPNGLYLFALDGIQGTLNEYTISSNGTLSASNSVPCAYNLIVGSPNQVYVAPSGKWVVCAMGTVGEVVYSLNESTGALTLQYNFAPSTAQADYAITIDSNDFLYVARTGYLVVYALDASAPGTSVGSKAIGSTPRGITLDRTGGYVYASDYNTSEIYGFGISGNTSAVTLTTLSGSPFTSATDVTALAPDNSGKYFLSLGYSASNGIQLYSLSSGVLAASGSVAGSGTTTTIPAVMALTH